jgi:DNA-binding response OmpR family regulator
MARILHLNFHAMVKNPKILIAEKDKNSRNALRDFFILCNFSVETASNAFVITKKILKKAYDFFIMDEDLTSNALLKKIALIKKDVKIYCVLTQYDSEFITKLQELGIENYMEKPINPNKLKDDILKSYNSKFIH